MFKRTLLLTATLSILIATMPNISHAAESENTYCEQLEKPFNVQTKITAGFHDDLLPFSHFKHHAVDLAMEKGTPVYAPADGTVVHRLKPKKHHKQRWSYVAIQHSNNLSSILGQLSKIVVKKGDAVKAGDIIGYSGGKGKGAFKSTGPHLHFAVRENGMPVDPTCIVQ